MKKLCLSEDEKTSGELESLLSRRRKIQYAASFTMAPLYFGFMALFSFGQPFLGHFFAPGLTFSILLGFLVIVGACVLSLLYVIWLHRIFDRREKSLIERGQP